MVPQALTFHMQAQKRNYTYPRYVWITYHWYPKQWWTENVTSNVSVSCTEEELESFLERVLTIQRYETLEDENATTEFGRVSVLLNNSRFTCIRVNTHVATPIEIIQSREYQEFIWTLPAIVQV